MTLKKFLTSKKQLILTHFLVFGLLLLFLTPLISFADDATAAATPAAAETVEKSDAEAWIQGLVWKFVNNTFGLLVAVGGFFLDYAISWFVVGFGDFYINKGIGIAIDELWKSVRDIFNLTFIFGLVYIGFKMILDSSDSSAKKTLATLIMAALLVNFSLFFTKAVIDFSNIAAKQFVEEFRDKPTYNYKVSEKFKEHIDLQTVNQQGAATADNMTWSYIFGAMYLYIITAFVFFAGAFLLTVRFVVLNIYMLLSPVMFIGWVFPKFDSVTKKYWSGFLGQAFFAPAYFLMIYFSMEIIARLKISLGSQGSLANAISANESSFDATITSWGGVVTFFLLASGFMIASIMVAKKIGTVGADKAISMVKGGERMVRQKTVSAATYLPRAGARMGTNWAGSKLQTKLNNIQAKQDANGNKTWGARLASTNGVDRKLRGSTQAMKDAQFGTGTTNEKEDEYRRKTNARANQTSVANQRATDFKQQTADIADSTKSTADLTKALENLGKTIKAMSKEEKNDLDFKDLTNKSIAIHLTDDDIKNIEATGKYSAQEIQQIKTARKHAFRSVATHGSTLTNTNSAGVVTSPSVPNAAPIDTRSTLGNRSTKDAGNMPVEVFKEIQAYDHISPAQVEERIKNGIDPTDYPAIRLAIENHLGVAPGTTPSAYPAALANNKWAKWANSNSVHAATIFS